MKSVYFIYQDDRAYERQSDGVEFCIIPEFHDGKIYFYCDEYSVFWDSIDNVGNLDKSCDFFSNVRTLEGRLRPATLSEISDNNLIIYVDTIKEIDGSHGVTYIHLK